MDPDKRSGTALALAGSTLLRVFGQDVRARTAFSDLVQAVAVAEETGYESVWVPDHGVWDPFSLLAAVGQRSQRIGLATGVVTMTSRSPEAMAVAATTLADVSGGRAILGLGSGGETRLTRVSEYLTEVGMAIQDHVPIYLATLGPRMVELAGTIPTAGILLNWCTPARVERARKELASHGPAGREAGQPEPPPPSVAVYVRACLGHDAAHALEALRPMVAMYAAMPAYRRQLEAEGMGELAAAAAEARRRGDAAAVPEELVDELCIRGSREDALARFDQYREAGANLVVVYPVPAQEPVSSLMGTIMAAAPDPAVEH
jgi:5,10-methylenetetrahydromethanopterin reductase